MSSLSRYGEKIINPSYYSEISVIPNSGKIIIDEKTGQINLKYPYSDLLLDELQSLEQNLMSYERYSLEYPHIAQKYLQSAIEYIKKDILKKHCI